MPWTISLKSPAFVFVFFSVHFFLYGTSRTVAARIALVCQGAIYVYARKYQAYGYY